MTLFLPFFISLLISLVIIRTQKMHNHLSGDHDFDSPQKFHTLVVPRIGGLSIALALFITIILQIQENTENIQELFLLISAVPVFGVGIAEDLTKKISVRSRLLFTAIGASIAILLLGARIDLIDIPGIDALLSVSLISIAFTIFAVTGLANAYNIIDGFNGLASMTGILTLMALGYVGLTFNDPLIVSLSFTMASAILGFFLLNYPRGLIFLGDGGAYLIGFWIATISVMIVSRHNEISPWFAVMVNAYPIVETLFTIYRRKFHQNKSPGRPDGIHLHTLIYRRVLKGRNTTSKSGWLSKNAKTSIYIWVLASIAIVPAIFFSKSTPILLGCLTLFVFNYLWLYKKIVSLGNSKFLL